MQNIRSFVRIFLGTAALAALPLSGALAGFEWTPPATQQVTPPMMAVPATDVSAEVLPSIAPQDLPAVEQAIKVPAPVVAKSVKQFPDRDFAVVQGFGSDIPLVLVMNQVVPPEYSYSFDDTVDQGMRISWNGGKPWNLILEEALAKHGYGIMIVDDVVWVRDEIYPVDVAAPAIPHPAAPMHTLPVDMTAGVMTAIPPAPRMPHETATSMNVVQSDDLAPAPLTMEMETPRTQSKDYNPSYPRRVPPQIDHSAAMPMQHGRTKAAKPEKSGAMPVPLMPFKKAAPKPVEARRMGAPSAPVMQPQESLPVISAIPSTAAASAPMMDTRDAQGPVLDPFEIIYWRAQKGEKLRAVLKRWSDEANVALIWNAAYDYELPGDIAMHGTFPDVISQTLMTFANTEPRPIGKLHPNLPAGPSVLSIDTFTTATTN